MLGQTGRGTGLEQEWAPLAVGSAKTILTGGRVISEGWKDSGSLKVKH